MAKVPFTYSIEEADAPRVILASAKKAGWKEGDVETVDEACIRYWRDQVKKVVIEVETQEAMEIINAEKMAAVENIVIIEPDVV